MFEEMRSLYTVVNMKIPNQETRVRHLARMRELNKRMDKHIIDLDELNARLDDNLRKQRRRFFDGGETQQITSSSNE
jgi:macrodomain Ter protein organizer (MatP/YcbG family)